MNEKLDLKWCNGEKLYIVYTQHLQPRKQGPDADSKSEKKNRSRAHKHKPLVAL